MAGDFLKVIAKEFEGRRDFVNATVKTGGIELFVGTEGQVEDV
jgi:hypothetical protein